MCLCAAAAAQASPIVPVSRSRPTATEPSERPGVSAARRAAPRSTVSDRVPTCPVVLPDAIAPERWPPARNAMVPAGATLMEVCSYPGITTAGAQLVIHHGRIANGERIGTIAKELDALPRPAPSRGPVNCPADNGAELFA